MIMFQRPIFSSTITWHKSIYSSNMVIIFLLCYCYALDIKKAHGQQLVDKEAGVPLRLTAVKVAPSRSLLYAHTRHWAQSSELSLDVPTAYALTGLPPYKEQLAICVNMPLSRLPTAITWRTGFTLCLFSLWLQLMRNTFHGLHLAFNTNLKIRTKSPLPCKRNALLQMQLPWSGHQSVILGLSSF